MSLEFIKSTFIQNGKSVNEYIFGKTPTTAAPFWGSGPKSISLLGNTRRDPTWNDDKVILNSTFFPHQHGTDSTCGVG